MHSFRANLQVCVGGHAHQLVKVHVHPQLDLLLVFALVSVLNGLDCMLALNDMHVARSLHAINNTAHHVFFVSTVGIDP